eukprot:gnl/TRDRNA2_/TRDRNA2_188204_c0_seq1.p1 gnl/TRDRNA2_/TRDRNA2_188204_c0~~gnl/TRDRNA2_/TRDRNA2_188204_c0_seq1.p1  ORF type:complete len:473 (-),score=92.81 gnl/TRDRNA2_/TRDRNA2_188204_c0_seq1:39-1457(-)
MADAVVDSPPRGHSMELASRPQEAAWRSQSRVSRGENKVMRQLWKLYSSDVLPAEQRSFFEHFNSAPVSMEEFECKPQVLLLGQYSTGKTSMVQWLTRCASPHFDVRPQPSTDKFMAVVHGEEERLIHGNAATCMKELPYQGLSAFGGNFLNSFQTLVQPAGILRDITFIDTPGVLSGSKQRIGRDYDFASVCAWLAQRADLVLLTFDAHKLDISDEFQEVMEVLRPFAGKVRCVLNKADQIDAANLVRVYGALLWNVGKIFRTPEVARVFISSFWDQEYRYKEHQELFREDKEAVLKELRELPNTALLRKINNFVGRVRKVKAHICITAHIRSQLPIVPYMLGMQRRLHQWVDQNLEKLFEDARRIRNLAPGDMPELDEFRRGIASLEDLSQLPLWCPQEISRLSEVIDVEMPRLMSEVGGVSDVHLSCRQPDVDEAAPRGLLRTFFGSSRGSEDERDVKRRRTSNLNWNM